MQMTTSVATARIARDLKNAEAKADEALLAASALMKTLVEARTATGVVPHTGQEALIRLARAQVSLIEGSTDIFRVHDHMSRIGREMGIMDEEGSTPALGSIGTIDDVKAA